MSKNKHAMLLAGGMITIAVLAVFDIVPEEIAQYAPLALLAIFPTAWLSRRDTCSRGC